MNFRKEQGTTGVITSHRFHVSSFSFSTQHLHWLDNAWIGWSVVQIGPFDRSMIAIAIYCWVHLFPLFYFCLIQRRDHTILIRIHLTKSENTFRGFLLEILCLVSHWKQRIWISRFWFLISNQSANFFCIFVKYTQYFD